MEDFKKQEINKIRNKLKKSPTENLLMQKPFAEGMYRFGMFIIDYYARVRQQLEIDYEAFMILQVTVSHQLYSLNKKEQIDAWADIYTDMKHRWIKSLVVGFVGYLLLAYYF